MQANRCNIWINVIYLRRNKTLCYDFDDAKSLKHARFTENIIYIHRHETYKQIELAVIIIINDCMQQWETG